MTKVDFYILDGNGEQARGLFACRIAEKAYQSGHDVYIHTTGAQQSEWLDQLLWTFRDGSFVPHERVSDPAADTLNQTPVHIGHDGDPMHHNDVLITLDAEVPLFFSRFHRVIEIVTHDEEQRSQGRVRYKFYRERGYPLETHDISMKQ